MSNENLSNTLAKRGARLQRWQGPKDARTEAYRAWVKQEGELDLMVNFIRFVWVLWGKQEKTGRSGRVEQRVKGTQHVSTGSG